MESRLEYSKYSDTIRQMPENFLIAHRKEGVWRCDPDLASNKDLATKVFLSLFTFENKYEQDPINLLKRINNNISPQLHKNYSVDWDGESHVRVESMQKGQILLFRSGTPERVAYLSVSLIEFQTIVNHEI